jgi:hypothetical protein
MPSKLCSLLPFPKTETVLQHFTNPVGNVKVVTAPKNHAVKAYRKDVQAIFTSALRPDPTEHAFVLGGHHNLSTHDDGDRIS